MAEKLDPKELVSFKALLMANSMLVDSLIHLLIEKGVITNEEFITTVKQVQTEYQSKGEQNQ